jgi:hypothetical protein
MMSAWGMLSSGLVQRSPREQHQEHDKQSVIQMRVMVKDIVPTCRVCISPLGTPTRYVDMLLRIVITIVLYIPSNSQGHGNERITNLTESFHEAFLLHI